MGRNAQPIEILKANGKKHLTKAETTNREKSEMKFGTNKLICPNYIKNNNIAYEKWKEITKIYKDVDFVSSGDSGLLARYCMTHCEYIELLERKNRIDNIFGDCDDVEDYVMDSEEFDSKVKKKLLDMISTTAILNIEAAINKKMDMLIKMEDRLFLSPLAKIKNVAKAPEEKEVSKFAKFGVASG